jgi:Xaa-Pro aminopeptidase
MRHPALASPLFSANRGRLKQLMSANSLAVVNANDLLPTNADGTFLLHQNADLFYLTGVRQEESILLLYPDAPDPKFREILFLRQPSELLATWEGPKLTREQARAATGIRRIEWLNDFPAVFHRLMCECDEVYLNTNEHKRAVIEVETRDARFVRDTQRRYPLHRYQRLARLMHRLRVVKSEAEVELVREACALTRRGFERVLRRVRPGWRENEVEAEFAYEFIRGGGGFAYPPIVASGAAACVLHYVQNNAVCRAGDLLLLDVGANYSLYNADMTRTIPVSGRFTRRQRQVYEKVLCIQRAAIQLLRPGLVYAHWHRAVEMMAEEACLSLGLLTRSQVRRQDPDAPAVKEFFMHGTGHPLGLDVHDVGFTTEPMQAGWIMTCEPALYLKKEGLAVRLEDDILLTENGPVNLMGDIPIEVEEIEERMAAAQAAARARTPVRRRRQGRRS